MAIPNPFLPFCSLIVFVLTQLCGASEVCTTLECSAAAKLFQQTMDLTADPCDDFYQFVCGRWGPSNSVPFRYYDHTTQIDNRIYQTLRGAMENAVDTEEELNATKQMQIFYDSCVGKQGYGNGSSWEDSIRFLLDHLMQPNDTLGVTLGRIRRWTGQNYLIGLSIAPDFKNTRRNRIFVDSPEFVMPKGILLFSSDDYSNLVYSTLSKSWGLAFQDVPITDINETVDQIVALETQLVKSVTDDDEQTKPGMFNLLTLGQINSVFEKRQSLEDPELAVGVTSKSPLKLDWVEYVQTVFENIASIDDQTMVDVKDVQYLRGLAEVLSKTSVNRLKNYLRWQLLNSFGNGFLTDQHHSPQDHALGRDYLIRQELDCVKLLDSVVPFALSYKYIKITDFPDELLARVQVILKDVIYAFQEKVAQSTWMEPGTKLKAISKAAHVRHFLGYPKWLRNGTLLDDYYEGLQFYEGDFLRNLILALKWDSEKDLMGYAHPVDTEWSGSADSPLAVDAFYDDELNSITIPIGFLQPPFIGMGMSALDYGALGFFIGHELVHGFDTEGRYSDEYGRLSSWWTPQTLENFNRRTLCIEEHYDNFYVPVANQKINGKQTLKENIADNGGLEQAYRAYQLSIERNGSDGLKLPGMEKFSGDQLFFLAFAQSWCSYVSPETLLDMVRSNEHSPPKFRVLGSCSNFPTFSDVWNCPNGTNMNPDHKCLLW